MYFSPARFIQPPYSQRYALISPTHGTRLNLLADATYWIGDNGAFTGFNEAKFYRMLEAARPYQSNCLFVVAPDVLLDARATLHMYAQHAPRIRAMGYRVAYVAQNGAEHLPIPECDALFLGGNDEWRFSGYSEHLIELFREAKRRNLWIHVGRVNSQKRLSFYLRLGADSCDGTQLAYRPNDRLPEVNGWRNQTIPLFIESELDL